MQEDLRLILNNVRNPEMNRADLFAIVAGCRAGEKRVMELCDRFGKETYLAALQALLDRTYEAMRTLIQLAIPEEPQTFVDYVDDDGLGNGPFKMQLTIWREGDHAFFDWSGTDPQALGPVNFYLSEGMFKMFIGIYLIMVNDPQILFNDGFYPLLHVVMPKEPPEPALPGRARVPHPCARAPVRRARRRALQERARAQHGRRLRHEPVHALLGLGRERGLLLLDGDPYGGIPGDRSATGWTATRGGRSSRTSRPSTSRPTTRCGSTATRRSPTRAARACTAAATAEKRYVYLEPGEVSIHDDRWLTRRGVSSAVRSGRAPRSSSGAPTGRSRCCRRSATTSSSSRATCSSTARPRRGLEGPPRPPADVVARDVSFAREPRAREGRLRRGDRRRRRRSTRPRRTRSATAARRARRRTRVRLRAVPRGRDRELQGGDGLDAPIPATPLRWSPLEPGDEALARVRAGDGV